MQITALFRQKLDPAGQPFPDGSTTYHLADVSNSLGADVAATTIGLKQLLNVLQVVPEMVRMYIYAWCSYLSHLWLQDTVAVC